MPAFAVTLDVARVTPNPTEDQVAQLVERLAGHSGLVSGGPGHDRLSATLKIEDKGPQKALGQGMRHFDRAARLVGLDACDLVRAEVMTIEEQGRTRDEPPYPDLVGPSEVADLLGVSRQRVHQLYTQNQAFPRPVVEVRMGPLWTRAGVEAFAESWERRPGRPRRNDSAASADEATSLVTFRSRHSPRAPAAGTAQRSLHGSR